MTKSTALSREGVDVILSQEETIYCLDSSGSMSETMGEDPATGMTISKMAALKKALLAMLEARRSYTNADKVGMVAFGGMGREMASVIQPLNLVSSDHDSAVHNLYSSGTTPMYQGIERAARELANAEGMVRMVIASDGMPDSDKDEILSLVEKLSKQYGFIIDTIGVGAKNGKCGYDEQFMKDMAERSGGNFYPIDNVDEFIALLKQTATERQALLGSGIRMLGDGQNYSR